MIQLSDTPTNTSLMYVYVKNFKWHSSYETEQLEGHPMDKKVYRAAYNNDTQTYRVYFKSVISKKQTAIVIPSLSSVENGYDAEIIKLTPENILKIDLTLEDLKQIIAWDAKQNKDLKEAMGFDKSNSETRLIPVMSPEEFQEKADETREFMEFMECSVKMYRGFPLIFEAVHELIHYINNFNEDQSTDSISISLSRHGAGYNVGRAMDALAVYMGDNRKTNFERVDLLKAIYNLLYEHARTANGEFEQ